MKYEELDACKLCPRKCGVNRNIGKTGACGQTNQIRAARAKLHFWEEPCISGTQGSGAVFFTGCNLGCVYCQNRVISYDGYGEMISEEELAEIFLRLQSEGAANINLVTPTHFVKQIVTALQWAKEKGLSIPIVYNSSGYELVETLKLLDGLVDIYLPDCKYRSKELAKKYSMADDYFEYASKAIEEMYRQTGNVVFGEDGLMKKGVIVRHMLLPGHVKEAKAVVSYLQEQYGDSIYISMMNQYTPFLYVKEHYPEIARKVTKREYDRWVDYALDIGVKNGFIQEGETAKESFIPEFRGEGIKVNEIL